MALRIKKKKQGYGSGPDLAGGPAGGSWSQVPPITPPSGLGLRISAPKAPGPITSDSTLEGTYKAIQTEGNNRRLDYRQNADDLRRQYGFSGDANNPYGFGGVDPANPFSKASLLQKSYQTAQGGYRNSYAARGLGRSGAARAAQQFATGQYQQGYDGLVGSLGQNLGALSRADRDLETWAAREGASAYNEFLQRRPDPEPVPVGAPVGPSYAQVAQPQYANNPWVQRGLKGPNGEQLVVTNKGTYYRRKSDGKAIYIKRN